MRLAGRQAGHDGRFIMKAKMDKRQEKHGDSFRKTAGQKGKTKEAWAVFLAWRHSRIVYLTYFLELTIIHIWEQGAAEWRYMEKRD